MIQEPIKLLDVLVLVVPCPSCHNPVHVPFSAAVRGQELDCLLCHQPLGMKIGRNKVEAFEPGFQVLQAQIREQGCWVEVRPFP